MSVTAFNFGEWLPDQPELGNQGLTEALNVIAIDLHYEPFLPLSSDAATLTLSGVPAGAFIAISNNSEYLYAATGLTLQIAGFQIGPAFTTLTGTASLIAPTHFVQYDNLVIAVGPSSQTLRTTVTSASYTVLATSGSAPDNGSCVGVIGQFVLIGSGNTLQWSAIADPTNWPTPNSATAIATQAGSQNFLASDGNIIDIFGGDQFGVVLQPSRVTRVTYVGPPVVFQFDTIDQTTGTYFFAGSVQVGKYIYYIAKDGFKRTDGVTVEPIGAGKVDRYFLNNLYNVDVTPLSTVTAGYDYRRGLVYWSWPGLSSSTPANLLVYNPRNNRWTRSDQSVRRLVTRARARTPVLASGHWAGTLTGFDTTNRLRYFDGTATAATVTSGEVEPSPGQCALVNGIKPIIASTGTAPTIGVQVGSRDDQSAAVSYSTTTTPTTRTGFADFRADNRFHRARVFITGDFQKAQGVEVDAIATGAT